MKKITYVGLILTLLLSLTACGKAGGQDKVQAEDLMRDVQGSKVEEADLDLAFAKSQINFTVELFQKVVEGSDSKNTLISPTSIQLALSMTANGAEGETKEEMEQVLAQGITIERLNQYYHRYLRNLEGDGNVQVANSIWFRDDEQLTVEEDFLQKNADYYNASIYKAPFDSSTVSDMNQWVKDHTKGMIDRVVDEIEGDTVMYLLNALAFEAEWETRYEKSDVRVGVFTSIEGEEQYIDMLHSTENYYIKDEYATGFKKDYKGGKYSYVVLLPNEDVDINTYVAGLTGEGLQQTLLNGEAVSVVAVMPKFTLEYEEELNETLQDMGMKQAFLPGGADFSGLGTSSVGNIYISKVLHKTFIQVDEQGTKAAAVTAVEAKNECASMNEYEVVCNRPFLYMIVDNETNLPIFMGTMMNVSAVGSGMRD